MVNFYWLVGMKDEVSSFQGCKSSGMCQNSCIEHADLGHFPALRHFGWLYSGMPRLLLCIFCCFFATVILFRLESML